VLIGVAALADSLHPGKVLDGELVALDSNRNPNFNALQMLALIHQSSSMLLMFSRTGLRT
jgi:ATP-dependent DNA ligase